MKIAIMQPYLFPYIGYFQLISAVDKFVIYDDVNYIKQGWINRNNILLNGNAFAFSVPLKHQSSFSKIHEVEIQLEKYNFWRQKFLRTVEQSYKKSPFFNEVFPLINRVFNESHKNISDLAVSSIQMVIDYLKLKTEVIKTSRIYANSDLSASVRVIDICKRENAAVYINPSGGMELYDKQDFRMNGLELFFLKSDFPVYKQFGDTFIPYLSIIDVLMFNSPESIRLNLPKYNLL